MSIKRFAAGLWAAFRVRQTEGYAKKAVFYQASLIHQLIATARFTAFGKAHHFRNIHRYEEYKQAVPVSSYEDLKPYIDRICAGESNVLWTDRPLYLAKTSGTTSGAKYIPITRESMPGHIRGARDVLLSYIHQTGNSSFLDGKMIFLSGSPVLEPLPGGILVGRLSGIAQHHVPAYLQRNRVPTYATNCIEDWEEKIDRIIKETQKADLRLVSGIPPWVQMWFERLYDQTGKTPAELWQNLSVYVQGGVDFTPYKDLFFRLLGKKVDILEVYPASEGFIAYQNDVNDEGLLLMLDNGIFYEFIPLEEYDRPDRRRLSLQEVELGKNYALILTTNAGLWAYDLGDTVKFTSLHPPKIKVTGRVKHFISAFGEHVIEEEVNYAMQRAIETIGGEVAEFMVAPFISEAESYHEWLIEFSLIPNDINAFASALDHALREKNIYYDDLRKGNILSMLKITLLAPQSVREYMKSVGKLGGQNKFPRLSNHRSVADILKRK
jgi:hypothetical protein